MAETATKEEKAMTTICPATGKIIYRTQGEARAFLRQHKGAGRATVKDLHIYQCEDHFHLSKVKPVANRFTAPKPGAVRKTDVVTDGEWRNMKNRVRDLGRQIANEELKEARKRVRELAPVVAQDREWLKRMADAAEFHKACADELSRMLEAHFARRSGK